MYRSAMDFYIMNGAGNRFAIFDARGTLGFQVSKEIVIIFALKTQLKWEKKEQTNL